MDENELSEANARPPVFKSAFESGLLITAILIIYTMALYLLDLYMVQWLGYVAIGIMIVALYVAGNNYRKKGGRAALTYGKAFKFLFFTLLVASVIGGIFNFIYFTWIAPDVIDFAIEESYNQMLDRGLSEDQAEQQMQYALPWMTNWSFALFGAVGSIFWGTIASLIMAAMLKRDTSSI